ncbi:MAG: phospholipase [Sphingobacteriia bacterium]|nr:phospholipase [Sphingobacteriia bacterium]
MITGPEVPPISGNKPDSLVITLHGYGADGYNLLDIAKFMSNDLPTTHFLSPNAPERCEMGGEGYQWFSLNDRTPSVMISLLRNAEKALNEYIDYQLKRFNLTEDKLIVLGFSQGTYTSLHTILRRNKPIAGLIGFSGALISPATLKDEIKSRPKICLLHGDQDDVVAYESMNIALTTLSENDLDVHAHTMHGVGHYISYEGLEIALKHIKTYLNIPLNKA